MKRGNIQNGEEYFRNETVDLLWLQEKYWESIEKGKSIGMRKYWNVKTGTIIKIRKILQRQNIETRNI